MYDAAGKVLYVGKAKQLKQRLSSYFQSKQQDNKTHALVARIANIQINLTHTETEALILEYNLIKQHQPPYNILLRDDKSYPYLFLSNDKYPQLRAHRGIKRAKGRYFGPYPHGGAVRESLQLLQKLFPVRQCDNHFFRNRSRPCLQYQIKRCNAPCVGLVDVATYQQEVDNTALFLQGKSQQVLALLSDKMQQASKKQDYEQAMRYRDQIRQLRRLQQQQYMETGVGLNIDVLACVQNQQQSCIQLTTIRDGRHLGQKIFYPKHPANQSTEAILNAFLSQYYLNPQHNIPHEIVINLALKNEDLTALSAAIGEQSGHKIPIHHQVRDKRKHWLMMAVENAQLQLKQPPSNLYRERLTALSHLLKLEQLPEQIECFDISHSQGEATVASCVVFDSEGAKTDAYRRFNINNITAGDDYAAMQQVLTRRYQRLLKEDRRLPDLVLIDGGKGQLQQAVKVFESLQLNILAIGVAKGEGRKAGLETLIFTDKPPINLNPDAPALHLIQTIRDEAHRFAISGHRQRRDKKRQQSPLEGIQCVGKKRRQQLLRHFGGLQGIQNAAVNELQNVPNISATLAQRIYDALH